MKASDIWRWKKLNFDGPDGYKHYWYDLRKKLRLCFSWKMKGESVWAWGDFSHGGFCYLNQIPELMDSGNIKLFVMIIWYRLGVLKMLLTGYFS